MARHTSDPGSVQLRDVIESDLPIFFEQQLDHVPVRPLYGRTAKDNIASLRVMEKCGFTICGEGKGFADARGQEVEEFILRLEASESVDTSGVEK